MSHYYGNCPKCKETECIDVDTDTCSECGYQKGDEKYEAGYREGLEAAAKELGVMAAAAVERAQEAESTGDFTLMNIRRTVAQGMREGAAAIRALAKEGR